MLVHAYLTNGFVEMAKVFLESLYRVHGKMDAPYVWLDTRNLKQSQMVDLRACYNIKRLHIVNKSINVEKWAELAGVSVGAMKEFKRQCEGRYVSHYNRVWKLMTAGDDRVKALYDLMWPSGFLNMPNWRPPPTFIAHFDIDTLFKKPLDELPKMMEEADIWLKLRPNNPVVKARITIDCIFVRGVDQVHHFFDRWRYHIARTAPPQRPVGWGQTTCWKAFEEVKDNLKYKTLPLRYGLPGRNHPDDVIWTGNIHKLTKNDCVKMFRAEMDKNG